MQAKITYRMARIVNPWDEKRRAQMEEVWCLMKVIDPEYGAVREEPVALFNLDSEAVMFQGHLMACEEASPSVSPVSSDAAVLRTLRALGS